MATRPRRGTHKIRKPKQYFGTDSVSITFDSNIKEKLLALEKKIKEGMLFKAAAAGAEVLYDEMKIRAPVYTGRVYTYKTWTNPRKGDPQQVEMVNAKPGQLRDSIFRFHDYRRSTEDRQIYLVGPNKRKAPHWYLVEYGTSKWAGNPYVRPTWEAKKAAAIGAAKNRLVELIGEAVRELAHA